MLKFLVIEFYNGAEHFLNFYLVIRWPECKKRYPYELFYMLKMNLIQESHY